MKDNMLDTMISAVRSAARATRFVHQSFEIEGFSKEDKSPVTVADWASQAVVSLVLSRNGATASLPLVGEEDAHTLRSDESAASRARVVAAVQYALGSANEKDCLDAIDRGCGEALGRFFTLDPVDGTKGFLRRQQYAISLALIDAGVVTHGVVGCPNLPQHDADFDIADDHGCTAFATRGGGVFMMRGDDAPHAVSIAPWNASLPVRACESVESSHSKQDLSVELLADFGTPGTAARLDSQAKYLVVARGGADAYLRLPTRKDYREKIWDHAAGALVASEAGARVCDVDGKPLDFNHGRELAANRGVFAGHPEVVARLVEGLARRESR